MIDARELMIGDWVQVHESYIDEETGEKEFFYKEPITMQVGAVYQNVIQTIAPWTDIKNGIGYDEASLDEIIPIPLTEEILEKNGFKKVNTQRYDFGDPNGDYYINVNPKKKRIHFNSYTGNCNLYPDNLTVHTLQHILRLYGLGNLADNFQV
nr:MAG TPA: hypothetical protein [Caudoviricetes sp.]